MKIAICSASGKLGAAVVKELIKAIGADSVIAIARTTEKASHLGVEVRKGDYNSKDDFEKALKGVDRVLLVSGMDKPENRIKQHRNVIEAAKLNGLDKLVYTSIVGDEEDTAFSPIVKSNRQTEEDVRNSGLNYSIGRNGIYIEPDLEYIDTYIKEGGITNCADEGKCTYTSRTELAHAYSQLLLKDQLNGEKLNLVGEGITQTELADSINQVYNTDLSFKNMSVEDYKAERVEALGDFLGTIIAGIYEGIKNGANDVPSDFEKVTGRPHKKVLKMIKEFKNK